MNVYSFPDRGPFTISPWCTTGFIFAPITAPWPFCRFAFSMRYNETLIKWSSVKQIPYYRKPTLADRGLFEIIGEIVGLTLQPYIKCCFRYTAYWWEKTGQRNSREEFGLEVCPWIYYSRNISTGRTCL